MDGDKGVFSKTKIFKYSDTIPKDSSIESPLKGPQDNNIDKVLHRENKPRKPSIIRNVVIGDDLDVIPFGHRDSKKARKSFAMNRSKTMNSSRFKKDAFGKDDSIEMVGEDEGSVYSPIKAQRQVIYANTGFKRKILANNVNEEN